MARLRLWTYILSTTLITLVIVGGWSGISFAEEDTSPYIAGSTVAEETSYLINQNFEGTGYDNSESWAEGGSPNEDYAVTVLRGSQSLYFQGDNNVESSTSPTFSGASTLWVHFMFRTSDAAPSDYEDVLKVRNDTTDLARVIITTSGYFRIYHGTTNTTSATSLADNTTYHVWFKYVSSSGSDDGVAELYLSETTTRGSVNISTSSGTSTASSDNIRFYGRYQDHIIDHVLADDAEIGNVDS